MTGSDLVYFMCRWPFASSCQPCASLESSPRYCGGLNLLVRRRRATKVRLGNKTTCESNTARYPFFFYCYRLNDISPFSFPLNSFFYVIFIASLSCECCLSSDYRLVLRPVCRTYVGIDIVVAGVEWPVHRFRCHPSSQVSSRDPKLPPAALCSVLFYTCFLTCDQSVWWRLLWICLRPSPIIYLSSPFFATTHFSLPVIFTLSRWRFWRGATASSIGSKTFQIENRKSGSSLPTAFFHHRRCVINKNGSDRSYVSTSRPLLLSLYFEQLI